MWALFTSSSAANFFTDKNDAAVKTFKLIFKGAKDAVWKFDDKISFVSFYHNTMPVKAWFGRNGNLIRTIRYYKEDYLNPKLKFEVNERFKGWNIFGITEVSTSDSLEFSIVLKKDKKICVVTMDHTGNILKKKKFNEAI